jgi:hypothetical protein
MYDGVLLLYKCCGSERASGAYNTREHLIYLAECARVFAWPVMRYLFL